MGGKVIGRLTALYDPTDGSWTVPPSNSFQQRQAVQNLQQLARGHPVPVVIQLERPRKERSLDQNALMWALLEKMAMAETGGRAGPQDKLACYYRMLAKYGPESYVVVVPPSEEKRLKKLFRIVRALEQCADGRVQYMCVLGSSQLDSSEFAVLLDGIFDTLAEMGISDAEITDYWRGWKGVPDG